jgi:hypothetical protein
MGNFPDVAAETESQTVSLTIPAKAEYLVLARLALSAVCRLTPLGADDVADLKLAISEAATTSLGEDPERQLRFDFELGEEKLVLELGGQVAGGARAPEDEQELSRAIVEATVDECEFGEDAIRLVKYLDSSPQ